MIRYTWKEVALCATWPTTVNESDVTATAYELVVFLGSHLQDSDSTNVGVQNSLDTWCPQIELLIVKCSITNMAFINEWNAGGLFPHLDTMFTHENVPKCISANPF